MANKQDLIAKVAEATELTKKDSAAADKKEPETTVKLRLVELSKNFLLQVKKYN